MEELIQQTQSALPILQTKRLILNCFKSADAKETYVSITPSLTRFMAWDPPQSEQGFATVWQNWLENMTDHKEYVFVIRHIETQELLDYVVCIDFMMKYLKSVSGFVKLHMVIIMDMRQCIVLWLMLSIHSGFKS